ncbi:MAG: isopentenyl phosphate kinase family protein [Candidatus Bathyarchaeota archaeon]|nr:MAG: isopentenyl phosphate kinase family protein [Candidatus Bathyarchaeota archaeon]
MQKPKPIVLKLGGSAITKKNKSFTLNKRTIKRLAEEVARADVDSLVIVHGGGSFGHPTAKKYRIDEGYEVSSQMIGFSKTHQAMKTLNKHVMDSLINQNIPAVEIQPSSIVITKSGRIDIMEQRPLMKLLELGFTPVLYGDAVLDYKRGFAILSGDQLVSQIAMRLNAGRIIMGVDVDGLYTADPRTNRSSQLIQHIAVQQLKGLQDKIMRSNVTDVTGGMLGKVLELIPALEHGINVTIVNALKPYYVYRALKEEEVVGTFIEKG